MKTWTTFDIETVATPWDVMPDQLRAALVAKAGDDEARARDECCLSPLTGRVAVVGLHRRGGGDEVESRIALCACHSDGDPMWSGDPGLRTCHGTERQVLQMTWDLLSATDRVVTWCGRRFDVPFIRARSAVHGMKAIPDNLLGNRFDTRRHFDAHEVLSAFGAAKMGSLDAACHAFGIESPKGEMDGSMVGATWAAERFDDVVSYCMRDVDALAELYLRVREMR